MVSQARLSSSIHCDLILRCFKSLHRISYCNRKNTSTDSWVFKLLLFGPTFIWWRACIRDFTPNGNLRKTMATSFSKFQNVYVFSGTRTCLSENGIKLIRMCRLYYLYSDAIPGCWRSPTVGCNLTTFRFGHAFGYQRLSSHLSLIFGDISTRIYGFQMGFHLPTKNNPWIK